VIPDHLAISRGSLLISVPAKAGRKQHERPARLRRHFGHDALIGLLEPITTPEAPGQEAAPGEI
jgi:hypothetical protein